MWPMMWFDIVFFLCIQYVFAQVSLEQKQQVLQSTVSDTLLGSETAKQPNIVFVLTDDQDLHMSSLDYMPHLQKHLVAEGTSFRNHYCTVALCCPSRVSLWTGRHAHNTNVTDINPPHGGYPKFISQGFNDNYFPLWMQEAGYDTYYVGRLLNAQSMSSHDKPHVRGWNGSDLLLDPYAYEYLNATMQRNQQRRNKAPVHEKPRSHEGQYSTDVVADKGLGFLNQAIEGRYKHDGRPFFLTIAPTSPHSNVHINVDLSDGKGKYAGNTATQSPPVAAKRHEHLFADLVVPRTPDFNPDEPSGVAWLRTLDQQNQTNIDSNDHFYRQRLRALQAVDEIIPRVVETLEEAGILDETYIFYSSDNGYHIGQHRLQPGKQCACETDINVPMIIRGPGIMKGEVTSLITSHVDLAPTFLGLAGVDVEKKRQKLELDGAPIPFHLLGGTTKPEQIARIVDNVPGWDDASEVHLQQMHDLPSAEAHAHRSEHINIEMWGIIMPEGKYNMFLYPNHTYKALRVIAPDNSYNLLYTVWCTNEHELYDLNTDPYALHNLHPEPGNDTKPATNTPASFPLSTPRSPSSGTYHSTHPKILDPSSSTNTTAPPSALEIPVPHLLNRLDALLMVLKTCKGYQCIYPWQQLHPSANAKVHSLRDALNPEFDDFYENQVKKVVFEQCEQAYVLESEGAVWDPRDGLGGES